MNKAFYNLDEEKRQKIINAGLLEFSSHGFSRSSTNRIVADASIGKGMLFYYFDNKLGLFKFLVDYSLEFIKTYYFKQIDMEEKDVFERLTKQTKIKAEMFKKHPEMSKFLSKVLLEASDHKHISKAQQDFIIQLQEKVEINLYKDIDTSLFREDLDIEQAINIIRYSIIGFGESLKGRVTQDMIEDNNYDAFYEEYDLLIKEMRKIFYKG